ncbi:MAG TPA: DUF2769 domain-containing protein [Candidatus Methanoculleus thermohydrogenotrophicum]|jgi:hypothetical protein|nr:DUF2769 domain-containing protein [Candidatus Methanoculleus thermohydrogenotrophicum]HPZ38178.1 DUF2769 domain-containing protein [Candidatus Methanoculleus thermohydrogenotrophicum]HQC91392.1 DUF2769 domain-containing protein [Candidatus Methanoculleus thermohydrogenotrophicum]
MDTFERLVQRMMQMPLAERINTLRAERAKCICTNCPTFTECAKNLEQGFFCFTGMSIICISHEVRCLCPTCPVPLETGLLHTAFYCTRGDEKARRYDQFLASRQEPAGRGDEDPGRHGGPGKDRQHLPGGEEG